MNLIFDIEADGLTPTKIWCIVAKELDGPVYTFDPTQIEEGIKFLQSAKTLIGHNIIGYDCPVIQKLYPWFSEPTLVVDTLLLSRLYHPNMISVDKKNNWKHMPLKLYGRHSLESYGYRLGEFKGSFGKDTDWKEWSQEMEDYCAQDVVVTKKLCDHFHPYLTGLR